jgi:hypothetical protein
MDGIDGTDTNQFGDMAIERMVSALPKDYRKPVFVLSDDTQLAQKLRESRPDLTINAVSSKAFLQAMRETGLGELAGSKFPDSAAVNATFDEVDGAMRKLFPDKREYHMSDFDTSQPYNTESQDYPFLATMQERKDHVVTGQAAERQDMLRKRAEVEQTDTAQLERYKEIREFRRKVRARRAAMTDDSGEVVLPGRK